MNKMQDSMRIEKVTINVGCGKDQNKLDKAVVLLKHVVGEDIKPVKTTTNKRIQGWGLRPGLPIGCKVTLRGKKAVDMLKALVYAKDKVLNIKAFDEHGNFSFGVHEYIDIENAKYNPDIGIMGLEVAVTITRKGFRVKQRSRKTARIGRNQQVTKEQAVEYVKNQFGVKILGE